MLCFSIPIFVVMLHSIDERPLQIIMPKLIQMACFRGFFTSALMSSLFLAPCLALCRCSIQASTSWASDDMSHLESYTNDTPNLGTRGTLPFSFNNPFSIQSSKLYRCSLGYPISLPPFCTLIKLIVVDAILGYPPRPRPM